MNQWPLNVLKKSPQFQAVENKEVDSIDLQKPIISFNPDLLHLEIKKNHKLFEVNSIDNRVEAGIVVINSTEEL